MSRCGRCGAEFSCGVADNPPAIGAADASCWCMDLPALQRDKPVRELAGCLCRDCLLAALAEAENNNKSH